MGIKHVITLVVDFEDKASFDAYIENPYHKYVGSTADEIFDTTGFIISQIEY